ncbi:pseudouridine synthase [Roseinatronobacter sp. S2]|uniref:pseudouridine synthase n=1 Tax=Roseinatronobacter sp. S2 TaxID=3035471 RepID=UPI00240FDD51|nr:pseudouridine synthase [Roseinatronobacter sp. S2]WFE73547.1 pseudouridine synthase [Roseinatronobacter sp. S2]
MEGQMSEDGSRIAKVLARAGVASRREAEVMITAGRVAVNGKRIDSPALNVTTRDRISVDGKPLAAAEPARLWMYHKPLGLVTTTRDEQGRQTVFDALPDDMPRVMSIGRLDLNSEGLLLLTNDGDLKRRLELPSTGWLRKYRVRVNGTPTDDMLAPLRDGVKIEGERFQPMIVNIDRQQGANAWLTIGIREGKNREIRRAMDHVGLSVNRLIRVSYGPFQLGQLAKGAVAEVKSRVLREQLGEATPQEDVVVKGKKPRPAGLKPTGQKPSGPKPLAQKPQGKRTPNPDSKAPGTGPRTGPNKGPNAGPRPQRANSAPRTATARGAGPAKGMAGKAARPPKSKR